MSLPIDKISWLKIIKRLFRKMLGDGGLHLLMTVLGIVHESLAIFCMSACSRRESSTDSEINLNKWAFQLSVLRGITDASSREWP